MSSVESSFSSFQMDKRVFEPRGDADLVDRNKSIRRLNHHLKGKPENVNDNSLNNLSPTTPTGVRRLIIAQTNDHAKNGQTVRTRTLQNASPIGINWAFTLIARIIRVVIRTLGIIISVPLAAFQQSRYGSMKEAGKDILSYNLVEEDLRRIGYEWVDLAITLFAAPFIGTINTLAPQAISTQSLCNYYVDRIRRVSERNQEWQKAVDAYTAHEERLHKEWEASQTIGS